VSDAPRRGHMEPLWDRIDANRIRLTVFVVLFVGGSVLAFDIFIAMPLTALFLLRVYGSGTAEEVGAAFWGIIIPLSIAYGAVASLWAAFTLLRSEKWLLAKLDATLIPTGTEIETKMALKDMAIAAGLPVAPALYLIDTRSTNAFVFAARRRRAVIGITRGFLTKLTLGERRAVFANLVARLKSGDTITSTGITALMWPVHAWRTSRQDSDNRAIDRGIQTGGDDASEAAYVSNDAAEGMMVLLVFGAGFAILSELVAAGHRRSQLSTAEKADAEGMLLLKDPTSMLSALTHCVELDNLVPSAGEAFSELFYCWTGVATNDETDPEWERVARLREVLGVEGIAWGDRADVRVPEGSFAPPAPRLSVPPPNETNRLN
jgi:Zn-dependent protease with chaperone function